MEQERWVRLDNASNIFLAARNDIDTKVFRLSAEMTDIVDPVLLQTALNHIYKEYPLFQSTLRRGIFWYYLERREDRPRVELEFKTPCSPIYHYDKKEFLFRVLYREKKIHLEVFHALTDGTGAFWFFEDLLTEYARLRYIKQLDSLQSKEKREKEDLEDSFKRYFRKKKDKRNIDPSIDQLEEIYHKEENLASLRTDKPIKKKVYQIKGTRTPDHRPRVINMNIPLKKALDLARKEKVSLTIYMTALYVLSVYQAKENKDRETTITVSIPINLRQFFPSITVRNFFSTTKVSYTFEKEETDFNDICQSLDTQFKKQLEKDALKNRLRRHIQFEFNPIARILIRPLKDFVLKIVNKFNNRKITVAMSNLGIANLPEEMSDFVENVYFYTSVIRPQFCMISYKENLNISFTSPFVETGIYHHFVQYLTDKGLEITVDSNKVTSEELKSE